MLKRDTGASTSLAAYDAHNGGPATKKLQLRAVLPWLKLNYPDFQMLVSVADEILNAIAACGHGQSARGCQRGGERPAQNGRRQRACATSRLWS